MSHDTRMSDLPQLKIQIDMFVRRNPGHTIEQLSRVLSIPLAAIHQAVVELKQEGYLAYAPTLKWTGKRRG